MVFYTNYIKQHKGQASVTSGDIDCSNFVDLGTLVENKLSKSQGRKLIANTKVISAKHVIILL